MFEEEAVDVITDQTDHAIGFAVAEVREQTCPTYRPSVAPY